MAYDINKFILHSDYPMDKIVYIGVPQTIINNGVTTSPYENKIEEVRLTNPYGKKCFIRARWSIDNGNSWQPLEGRFMYNYDYSSPFLNTTLAGLRAAISIGASDTQIVIRTANGYHGGVFDDGVNYIYTPISQTFIVEYALMELE